VLNNLGALAYFRGRWGDARALYERSRDARERTGAAVDAAYGSYNIAEILCDQGHLDDANELLQAATRVWRAAGDREGVAFAHSLLGLVRARSGDVDGAGELLVDARDAFMLLGQDSELAQADVRLAECAVLGGRPAEAFELAQKCIGAGPPVDIAALRTSGLALRDQGDVDGARAQLEKSHALALEAGDEFQLACTATVLAPLLAASEPATAAQLEGRARELFVRFGVIALPAWAPRTPNELAGRN
jgi:tetratricopeptide (TPR) repeat protein